MRKPTIHILAACVAFALGSCHSHDEHDHEHEGHDHETEAAEHGHEGHDHEEAGHAHEGAVAMEPEKAASFGIETTELTPSMFSEVIRVSGRIEPAPTDVMTVTARKSGIITLSAGITPGCSVSQGQNVATVSSKGVQGGDTDGAARAALDAAEKELRRLTPLYKDGLVTAADYNAAEKAVNEARALAGSVPSSGAAGVTAPCSGTVTELFVTSGQYVEVGAPVATVSRNSRLTLRADVPERYVGRLGAVATANFRPDYSERVFSLEELGGHRVGGAAPAGVNGYVPVWFSFISNGETLPGAYAEIWLKGAPRDNVLTVPVTALIEMQGNKYVYVCEHGHAYEKRLVTLGAGDGESVEILSGVSEGEMVVTKGATVVRMAETSAIAPPGHSHNH